MVLNGSYFNLRLLKVDLRLVMVLPFVSWLLLEIMVLMHRESIALNTDDTVGVLVPRPFVVIFLVSNDQAPSCNIHLGRSTNLSASCSISYIVHIFFVEDGFCECCI